MKPHAYAYARFSSKAQDKGSSLDRQYEATREMCQRMGWELVETLTDKGRSAWKGDHLRVGELGRFKQRVEQGDIPAGSYLVIENVDRLSRMEVKKARRWIEEVTDAGVSVAVCSPAPGKVFDEASLSGENIIDLLQYLLEAQRSNKESARKSDLQHDAIARFMKKAREGIAYSARTPMWLRAEKDGKLEVIEERAAIVRQIYDWSAAGIGIHLIAKRLNESFEPWTKPHSASAPTWKVGYVRDILTGWAVEGEYHVRAGKDRKPTGEVIHNYYPRVVPAELVAAARNAQAARRGATGPNHSEARNLFAGRVKCAHCGDTMIRVLHRNKEREYEYLKCVRFNNGADCVNTTLYRYDHFERSALKEILHVALDSSHFVKPDETGPLLARLAQSNKDVENMEAEQKRLLGFVMRNPDAAEAEDLLNEIRPQLAKLRIQRDDAKAAFDKAKGHATPEEHLQRVIEVRGAIYSDDDETRREARLTVRDAIRSVVQVVSCRRDYVEGKRTPVRQIMMTLAGGLMAYQFDNDGNVLQRVDMSSLPDDMLTGLNGTGAGQAIEAIKRRRSTSL